MTKPTDVKPLQDIAGTPAIYTIRQAADYLQATPYHIKRAVKAKKLDAFRLSERQIRITKDAINQFMQKERI